MSDVGANDALPFLSGAGPLGELIAAFDWGTTPLGPLTHWPPYLKAATSLMLRSKVPMVMLWGESGVMVYNAGYAVIAGGRHPQLLGCKVREGWDEVAEFNDHVIKVALAGGTLSYQDQEFTLHRSGQAEQVWLDLDYSPLLDDRGKPAGVLAVVVETTAKVQVERRLSDERERLAQLFQQARSFMAMLEGPSHRIVLANPNYRALVGNRPLLGLTVAEALPDAAAQGYVALLDQVYGSGQAFAASGSKYAVQVSAEEPVKERYVDFVFQPIHDSSGAVSGIFVEGVDVTDRVRAGHLREALVRLTDGFRAVHSPDDVGFAAAEILGEVLAVSRVGYGSVDHDTETLHVLRDWTAPGIEALAGAVHLREYGSFIDNLKRDEFVSIADVRQDDRTAGAAAALEARMTRSFVNVPVVEQARLVAMLYINHAEVRHWSSEDIAFVRDVAERTRTTTERVRGEAALRESAARLREANETLEAKVEERSRALMEVEARFRQSQKMEAIGQLTGGLAHDFNNLLAGMSASLQLIQSRINQGKFDNLERYIGMAQDSSRRAAALTQRLLAFSRRQTLDPKATDVNRLIGSMEDLIRRTVGPAVQVEVVGAGGLWLTKVDAPQLENALLNLCINARDAMALHGGRLTIETANKWMDERTAKERDLPPGQYISLCVTDTGTGMTADVVARAFDPFFTTKPTGQGTGLGLSMVYGFVRQSGGQVRIYSELGSGTTMCLYLPRHRGEAEQDLPDQVLETPDKADGETVLLIEDEETIRDIVAEELSEAGYRVLTAGDGPSGLRVLQTDSRIDLVVTDVGLPGGLNGRQVADAARVQRPALKVLFITGYAENAAVGNGLLEHGMAVITKPFDLAALVGKVRHMIEH